MTIRYEQNKQKDRSTEIEIPASAVDRSTHHAAWMKELSRSIAQQRKSKYWSKGERMKE